VKLQTTPKEIWIMTSAEDYKKWIVSAEPASLIEQLSDDVKTPLITAQNLVNMLAMMQNPSPSVQRKMESGELNAEDMLGQITQLVQQAFDVIDFYRDALSR
jgi:hypothetical protein